MEHFVTIVNRFFIYFFSLADNNRLSGEIPSSIAKLTALKRLYVVVWGVGALLEI
jgi:hypothetical protein